MGSSGISKMVDYEYEACDCIHKLSYGEKEDDMARMIDSRIEIDPGYKRILVLSELREARIGFNNIAMYVSKGANHVCLCGIRDLPFTSRIFLTCDLLSAMTQIPCEIPNTAAFYIRGRNHQDTCPDKFVPGLKSAAFFSLYLKGYANRDFVNFSKIGRLPKRLLKDRPNTFGQVLYCLPNHLVHFYPPILSQYTASCKNPNSHLFSYID